MWFGVISLFPSMFQALEVGITGRAIKDKKITINYWNPRDFTKDKHQTVDDSPYGGGPGMVMMAEPLFAAINMAKKTAPATPKVIYLSPQGELFNQSSAITCLNQPLILLAGRYEGIDERLIETAVDHEYSIGNYILSGGELAAMVMIDTISRLIPGVVGSETSVSNDSLSAGLLKYPQYTRPEQALNMKVPSVLLSGSHQSIERWRLKMSLGQTWLKRKDLLQMKALSDLEKRLLDEFIAEWHEKKSDG